MVIIPGLLIDADLGTRYRFAGVGIGDHHVEGHDPPLRQHRRRGEPLLDEERRPEDEPTSGDECRDPRDADRPRSGAIGAFLSGHSQQGALLPGSSRGRRSADAVPRSPLAEFLTGY